MNEKQGDLFDQRIRQALNALPDAPPPGSSFDAGNLWEHLRPEQSTPVEPVPAKASRRWGAWWLMAAVVAGLLMMWLWIAPVSIKVPKASVADWVVAPQAANRSERPNERPTPKLETLSIRKELVAAKTKNRPKRSLAPIQTIAAKVEPQPHVVIQPERLAEPTIAQMVDTPATALSTVSSQTATVASNPKRRWRVVHENELPAEDEAYQVRYQAGRFVQIGTGGGLSSASDESLPALRLPLSRKSTQ